MIYHSLFTLMTFIPIIFWFASSLWVALDAEKMPAEAWAEVQESKNVWLAISLLLMWPFGLFIYLLVVRKNVAAVARSIDEEALISKAADRIRNESNSNHSASEDEDYEDENNYNGEDYHDEPHAREDDKVFNYEESPSQSESQVTGIVIPPKPSRAPRATSSDKTAVHPVVPPKPTRSPRVSLKEDNER